MNKIVIPLEELLRVVWKKHNGEMTDEDVEEWFERKTSASSNKEEED